MKKLFAVILLVLFASSFSFAQINKNWDGTKPEVYKGSKNFVFMYAPFVSSNLGDAYAGSYSRFQDTSSLSIQNMFGVGFQYFVSNEISLALGVHFGSSSFEPTWAGTVYDGSGSTLGASLDANYHFKPLYSVSPYFGLNANFGMYSEKIDITSGSSTTNLEFSGSSIGFGLNFGFDWYFTPGLSLGGKYTFGMRMNSAPEYTYTSGSVSNVYTGPKTTGFGTGIASIMLNVHF